MNDGIVYLDKDSVLNSAEGDCGNLYDATVLVIRKGSGEFSPAFSEILIHKMNKLRRIVVEAGNPYYRSHCGVLYNKAMTILIHYPRAKRRRTYIMPDSVKSIAPQAFTDGMNGNPMLATVYLSKLLRRIPYKCFLNMRLWGVDIKEGLRVIGRQAFRNTNVVCPSLPSTIRSVGKDCFKGCQHLLLLGLQDEFFLYLLDNSGLEEKALILIENNIPLPELDSSYKGHKVMNLTDFEIWLEN